MLYYNYIRLFVVQIPIKKTKSGYGFTVSGFSPVFVCRVEKGECHKWEDRLSQQVSFSESWINIIFFLQGYTINSNLPFTCKSVNYKASSQEKRISSPLKEALLFVVRDPVAHWWALSRCWGWSNRGEGQGLDKAPRLGLSTTPRYYPPASPAPSRERGLTYCFPMIPLPDLWASLADHQGCVREWSRQYRT